MPEEMNRTKKALDGALRRLLTQKPLDQIRIRELTELCAIRRQSFYYHFTDVYQLFDWSLAQERTALLRRQERCLTWQQATEDLLAHTWENRSLYLALLDTRGREGLRQVLGDAINSFLEKALEYYRRRGGTPPDPAAEEARLLCWQTLLLALVEDWLRGELRQPPETVIDLLERDLRTGAVGAAWQNLPR